MIELETKPNLIKLMITLLGDDIKREGLLDTPKRVMNSWQEIYSGYKFDEELIKKLLVTFEGPPTQIVIIKDIEFYSMCEHHMLPFFGKAHIAYMPQSGKVIGASKLPRLLEVYSRRLQMQERIGDQVTEALMKHVEPKLKAAACVIEAKHLCIAMRGIQKQSSIMKTNSLKGAFLNDNNARQELMELLK